MRKIFYSLNMLINNVLIFDSKKFSKKDLEFQNKVLPLQPVSEKRLLRGAEKVSTFAARFAKTGTQSIDILKTSSKPTRFRKEER